MVAQAEACVFVDASASERSPVFGYSRLYWYIVMPIAGAIMAAYSAARLVAAVRGGRWNWHEAGAGAGAPSSGPDAYAEKPVVSLVARRRHDP